MALDLALHALEIVGDQFIDELGYTVTVGAACHELDGVLERGDRVRYCDSTLAVPEKGVVVFRITDSNRLVLR